MTWNLPTTKISNATNVIHLFLLDRIQISINLIILYRKISFHTLDDMHIGDELMESMITRSFDIGNNSIAFEWSSQALKSTYS